MYEGQSRIMIKWHHITDAIGFLVFTLTIFCWPWIAAIIAHYWG